MCEKERGRKLVYKGESCRELIYEIESVRKREKERVNV